MDLMAQRFQWYVPQYGGNRARYLAGEEPAPVMIELRLPTWPDQLAITRLGPPMDGPTSSSGRMTPGPPVCQEPFVAR
jgi:hypothetical protein